MKQYTILCPEDICIKALRFGAPLECVGNIVNGDDKAAKITGNRFSYNLKVYKKPTVEQMCGWLREKGVFIDITPNEFCTGLWASALCVKGESAPDKAWWYEFRTYDKYASYSEAMSAAIDKAIDYLEKRNNNERQNS